MSDKKKILVLTADAGFGHRSAAAAIAAALEESRGELCSVEVVNALDSEFTPSWLRAIQSDYDRISREMPELYKIGYDLSDGVMVGRMVENGLILLLYRALREILKSRQPDAIVSTFPVYQPPLTAIFSLQRTFIPLMSVVTDLATVPQMWFSGEVDLTVVPTETVRAMAIAAGRSPDRLEVIGIPVHPRIAAERRTKAEMRAELGWEASLTTLLFVGSKRVGRLGEILRALNHSALPLQLVVAAGGDDKRYAELLATEWHLPAHIYNFVDDIPAMMRASDAVVSKAGGLIVTESLAAGLPMLIIDAIHGQETGNVDFVLAGGAGERASDPVSALEILRHWTLDGGRALAERAESARRLGRPRAAFDIADRAWELAQRGPQRRDISQIVGQSKLVELFKRFGESWED